MPNATFTRTMRQFAGIDISRGAWVAVVIDDDGLVGAHYAKTLTELSVVLAQVDTITIDVPIGLSDTTVRACDSQARHHLGVRRSSLFMTPIRAALEAETHAQASAINRAATGQGISIQAYGLRHKIAETHQFLAESALTLYETHPETAFAVLNGAPFATAKNTWAGMRQREQLLRQNGIVLDDCLPAGAKAGVDDMLDAAVAALSAKRIANAKALTLGDGTVDHKINVPLAIHV